MSCSVRPVRVMNFGEYIVFYQKSKAVHTLPPPRWHSGLYIGIERREARVQKLLIQEDAFA